MEEPLAAASLRSPGTERGERARPGVTLTGLDTRDAAPPVQAHRLRSALARHPTGVVVVTGPGPVGLTVTTFNAASLDPPLASFYVARSSATWPRLRDARVFAVNVLAADQADIADRFARRDVDRFGPQTRWRIGPLGVPLITGAACYVTCELDAVVAVGDHWLVVGLVVGTEVGDTPPLLRHRGQYGRFRPADMWCPGRQAGAGPGRH